MNEIVKIENLKMPKDVQCNEHAGFLNIAYLFFVIGNVLFWTFAIVYIMEAM